MLCNYPSVPNILPRPGAPGVPNFSHKSRPTSAPNFVEFGQGWPTNCQLRQSFADVSPNLVELSQSWSMSGQVWPKWAQLHPKSITNGSNVLTNIYPKSGQQWPIMAGIGSKSAKVGRMGLKSPQLRAEIGRGRPNLARARAILVQNIWSDMVRLAPSLAEVGSGLFGTGATLVDSTDFGLHFADAGQDLVGSGRFVVVEHRREHRPKQCMRVEHVLPNVRADEMSHVMLALRPWLGCGRCASHPQHKLSTSSPVMASRTSG